jgi:soluble lytic murein transglycosylase
VATPRRLDREAGEAGALEETWRYWRARALERQGRTDARAIYRSLAQERTYYGFLAADRVGQPYRLGHTPLRPTPEVLARLQAEGGIQRAREFLLLKRIDDARREWEATVRGKPAEGQKAAAYLAGEWGWHDRAIFALARAEHWDDLALRFPVEHRREIDRRPVNRGWRAPGYSPWCVRRAPSWPMPAPPPAPWA